MSTSAKIVTIAVFGTVLYLLFAFLIHWLVISPSFARLERQQARRDILRCREAIQREVEHLDQFCFDWACWDDTYAYVETPNAEYERANLVDATLADNRLNLLCIVHATGKMVWGKGYDLQADKVMEFPEFARDRWGGSHPLLAHDAPGDTIAGLMLTSRGVMAVASRPIVTTNMEGPIRGAFVMGRLLTDELVGQLRGQTQVNMQLRPLPGARRENAAPASPAFPTVHSHVVDERTLHVDATLPSVFGEPAFLLRAIVPREIARTGANVTRLAAWSALGAGLVCLWAILYLMRRVVITPLTEVTRHVTRIGETGEMTLFDTGGRRDELGVLSRQFNMMLVRLEHDAAERERARQALRESEERFQRLLQAIDDML